MADKYPKPYVAAAPLTPEYDSYSYSSVFGFSVARWRADRRWHVRTPTGEVIATAREWRNAMDHALTLRP